MKKTKFKVLLLPLLWLLNLNLVLGQTFFKKSTISTTAGFLFSTAKNSPFLIRSNQYGVVPFESGIGYLNASIKHDYDSLFTINKKQKRFNIGYGLETHVNLGNSNQFMLPEAYVKLRYGAFEFYGGRRREIQGLVDTINTMGSYIWSGNALPVPKIEASIPEYKSIIGKGLVSIKGNFAHGWFGSSDSVKNFWLHQKSLYIKLGRPTWKIKMIGGFNHQVQWGGRPKKPFYDKISNQTIDRFGADFATFIKVAAGVSLAGKSIDNGGIAGNESGNRSGNHLGSLDLGMELNIFKYKILIYRQSIYEDGSLFYLNNIKDGLFGVSFKQNKGVLRSICYEYLNTADQGGSYFYNQRNELRGQDNYFNNGVYIDSWTYRGKTIGTPLFLPGSETKKEFKNPYGFSNDGIANNRINAYHLSAQYVINQIGLKTSIITSNNFGSFYFPYKVSQVYFKQMVNVSLRNNTVFGVLAYDSGGLTDKNFGVNLGVKRQW
jgi:Capsule assembly protein Wzi